MVNGIQNGCHAMLINKYDAVLYCFYNEHSSEQYSGATQLGEIPNP